MNTSSLAPKFENIAAGDPWYAGDHGIFLMNQLPALAFTSERMAAVMAEIVHTINDTPAVLNPTLLVETAQALHDLLLHLAQESGELLEVHYLGRPTKSVE